MRKSITAVILGVLMLGTVCSASAADITIADVDFSDSYFEDNRVNGGEAMLNVVFDVPDGGDQTTIIVSTEDFADLASADVSKMVYINQISTPESGAFEFPVVKDRIRSAAEIVAVDGCTLYIKIGNSASGTLASYTAVFEDTAVYGDATSDGKVNSIDLITLVRYFALWDDYDENVVNLSLLDLNGDGSADVKDVSVLARHIANWSGYGSFPYIKDGN